MKSFKSLRLTSQKLNTVASPYVFEHLGLWISQTSIGRLENISKHPTLSIMVKRITLSPVMIVMNDFEYNDFSRQALWKQMKFGRPNKKKQKERQAIFDHYMVAWKNCLQEQQYLFSNYNARQMLAPCFRRLPNLAYFRVSSQSRP